MSSSSWKDGCRRTAWFLAPAWPPPESAQLMRGRAAKSELSRANHAGQAARGAAGGGPGTCATRSPKIFATAAGATRCWASEKLPKLRACVPTARRTGRAWSLTTGLSRPQRNRLRSSASCAWRWGARPAAWRPAATAGSRRRARKRASSSHWGRSGSDSCRVSPAPSPVQQKRIVRDNEIRDEIRAWERARAFMPACAIPRPNTTGILPAPQGHTRS